MPTDETTTPLTFFSQLIAYLRKIILLLLPFFPTDEDGNPIIWGERE